MDQSTDEVQVSFSDLNVGEMYPIKQASKELRKFDGKMVDSVKLDISTSKLLRTTTYAPSGILKYAQDNIDAINEAAQSGKHYSACFYGAIINPNKSKRFIGRIHEPGEVEASDELLKEVEKMNAMVNKKKRSSSDLNEGEVSSSGSPMKIVKIEESPAASPISSPNKSVQLD